jgi:outer membrane protein insertion porin family
VERGETVTDNKVGETIRALYKTGFFEDVQLTARARSWW